MAACARSDIVCSGEVGVYHCWARCVRRAFLCGVDPLTGKDYEYRRQWLYDLQEQLASLLGLDICFRAEMSNHLHVVLRTRPDVVETWSDEEVAVRWLKIAKLKRGSEITGWEPTEAQVRLQLADPRRIKLLRSRLSSVSWFMGSVCENIARRANREDGCRGKFWEIRFGSRSLADEGAILVCGMYVELNQIRAGEAATPEQSRHTSAYDRIEGRKAQVASLDQAGRNPVAARRDRWLCELTLEEGIDADVQQGVRSTTAWRASDQGLLPIAVDDYLELLDWTGRQVREEKRGSIPSHLASILQRLRVNSEHWLDTIDHFESRFGQVVGRAAEIAQAAARLGRRWMFGTQGAAQAFT